jgi:hypothetical protein
VPQPWPRPRGRNALQAPGVCCHTMLALLSTPRPPQVSRRPGGSRFLEQARPDLLPGGGLGKPGSGLGIAGGGTEPIHTILSIQKEKYRNVQRSRPESIPPKKELKPSKGESAGPHTSCSYVPVRPNARRECRAIVEPRLIQPGPAPDAQHR